MGVGAVIVVVISAAVLSVLVGLVTSFATLFTNRGAAQVNTEDLPAVPEKPVVEVTKIIVEQEDSAINDSSIYWSFAVFTAILGVFLILAPTWFFGPSWRYFDYIPHNGKPMGAVCLMLGAAQAGVLWKFGRKKYRRPLSILFFLSGFMYWTAGMILGAEGLAGHQGLMEAPFMMFAGGYHFAHGAGLSTQAKLQSDKT